jgi:hypothetical protein
MSGSELPLWYPLANATDEQIDAWHRAEHPPFDEMREALPWLRSEAQLRGWLDAARDIEPEQVRNLMEWFPAIGQIPVPPKRLTVKED